MKKLFLSMAAFVLALSAASAYDPPLQGENLFYLSHPELMTEGVSVAGGGIESVMPASGTINPALIGLEERVSLDLGYTGMVKSKYSQAFGTGILIPTDWANFGGEMEFILDENCMGLGNSFNIKSFAAKQFMDRLYIGVGLGFGYEWTFHKDWMLTADIGAIYNFGDIAFLKNFRVGASTNNIGKTYASSRDWQGYPAVMAIRVGAAAEFVRTENFGLGLSLDVTTPLFMNLIFDSGIQFRIKDFVQINSSWEFNSREAADGRNSWIPTLGVVFKFGIGMGKSDFVKKRDWSKSELCPSAAWKNVDGDINLIGVGAVLRLGQKDRSGPDIEMN
ncbi:MAG: hypothetical protein II610_01865 [Treponema sp.]|nr:hypothetical protein [Treponema sp.]